MSTAGYIASYKLYIRGSELNPERRGFNVYDQQWHTTLKVLHNMGLLKLTVNIVPISSLSRFIPTVKNFDSRSLPILSYTSDNNAEEVFLSDNDAIEDHLNSQFPEFMAEPYPGLYSEIYDISCAFFGCVKSNYSVENVTNQLSCLEKVLESNNKPFFGGDRPCFADVFLFVRLYFLQVVMKYCKQYEIPDYLKRTRSLIYNLLKQSPISSSCPADQDIVKQYSYSPEMRIPLSDWKFFNNVTYSFEG